MVLVLKKQNQQKNQKQILHDSYPRCHDRMHFYLDAKYQITNKRETNTMYVHPTLNRLYHHKAYKYNLEAHTLYGVRQNRNYAPVNDLKMSLRWGDTGKL